jgi:cell division protein FtsQ
MIVKRNGPGKNAPARRIVKRPRPAVGETRPQMIVHRNRGVVIGGGGTVGSGRPRGPRLPRVSVPALAWRPGKSMLWGGAAIGAIAILGYGAYWTWTSPVFKVSNVEVVGAERLSASTIVDSVDLLGQSMFNADFASAQEELYAQPLVNSVRIERDWPNTVKVIVEERKPWGTWEQSFVQYTIDREGVVLGQGAAPAGSPVIKSSEPGNRITGDRVDYQAVDAAAEIYEKLPRQLGTTVAEVSFSTGTGVQVTTSNNQTALFGDSSSISYKLSVWAALAQEAQVRRINYTTIDLRYGNRPVLQ